MYRQCQQGSVGDVPVFLLISNSCFKDSVNSIAKTSAYQLQKTDIRVNTICPGLIETGMSIDIFDYARSRGNANRIGQLNPLGRYGVAEGASCLRFIYKRSTSFAHRDRPDSLIFSVR